MIKDSPYNNIRMEQIGKEYKPYRKPIIWWNISDDIILDILFDKRAIFSVVNFATYYERLTEMGFQIEFKENEIVVGKKCGEYIAKLEGFEMIKGKTILPEHSQASASIALAHSFRTDKAFSD